jgi:hypothetical protein
MAFKVVIWVQGTLRLVEGDTKRSRAYSLDSLAHNLDDLKAQLPRLLDQGRHGLRDILFVTDSALLLPAVEEIPPAETALAARLLAKRVEKAKLIDEPFSIGAQPILNPGEKGPARRYLVTVTGLAWLRELDQLFMRMGLRFVGVLPLAAGLRPMLRQIRQPPEQPFLLVTAVDGALYQVVGRSDGMILFYRTMAIPAGATAEGLQREIRRTLLFVEQKLNQRILSVVLAGEAGVLARGFNLGEGVEVLAGAPGMDAAQAGATLLRFRPASPENVLPRELALRERARQIRMVLNLGLAGILAFTVVWVATQSVQRLNLQAAAAKEETDRRRDLAKVEVLQKEMREYFRQTEGVRVVEEETRVPALELILRTLPGLVPPGLLLNRCEIRLDEKAASGAPPRPVYTVRLEGRTRQTNDAVLPLVKKLQDDLGKSPWDVGVESASGSGKNEKEIPRELKAPGRFYFYGRTQ